MNVNLFKAELAKNGLSIPAFADKLEVHKTTVYRWLENPGAIPLEIIQKMKAVLSISNDDLLQIFFA